MVLLGLVPDLLDVLDVEAVLEHERAAVRGAEGHQSSREERQHEPRPARLPALEVGDAQDDVEQRIAVTVNITVACQLIAPACLAFRPFHRASSGREGCPSTSP